ncbi:hypothetical protein [Alienimonas chondri]|uniref:FecR protein domain-containing protein n=1 Tax=Alienimonas chondri TaxID=2681879 RepID=A0ABX1VA99_9PLAN|nr:hypothetical protein [Alienimonas chondri]NNJ24802.1 hypothetical protein [Alienimonas chondri]
MRLTLRTLLAYLDDQLTPAEAREIGTKLQETPAARELAERAKETIRRRRLGVPGDPTAGGDAGAPKPAGPALDPNEVGAYLDNALPPERVAAVEQVCLSDDAHLAEVAAGHQILTQVLSEPVAVPPTLAARLVSLAPTAVDPDDPARYARPAHKSVPEMAAVPAGLAPAGAGFEAGLPEHLRQNTRSSWTWLPYAVVALLAALWLGTLFVDADLFNWGENADATDPNASGLTPAAVAAAEAEAGRATQGDDVEAEGAATESPAQEAARLAVEAEAAADAAEAARLATTMPVDPPPPETGAAPDSADPDADAQPTAIASGESVMADPTAPDATADGATTPDATAVPVVPAPQPAARLTVAEGGGLFALDPERRGFYAVPVGETVPTGVPLVVPEPLRALLSLEGETLSIELLGGTRALFAAAKPEGAESALNLSNGRIRIQSDAGASEDTENATIVLTAGGAQWRLTPQPGATAAVIVEPRRPRGAGADLAGSPGRAAMAVLGGAVKVVDLSPGSSGQPVPLPADSTAALVTSEGLLAAPGAAPAAAAGMFTEGVPGWAAGNPPTEAETLLADQFAEALLPGQPLEVSLPPLVEAEREIPARQAVATLALAGRAEDLARALKRTPHPSVVLVAADGLRTLLGRDPEQDAAVNDALDREFPPEARLSLGRLLDRLTAAEARDPRISAEMIAALESPELAVRTLAIAELERLTGVTKSYRPLDSPSQRESAIKRWVRELERNGALLPPEPESEPGAEPVDPAAGNAVPPVDPIGIDLDNIVPGDL